MRNLYVVTLVDSVEISPTAPHFGGKVTHTLYVIASSLTAAEDAVQKKYQNAKLKRIEILNYSGVPIVLGD
jgi:sugar lactone lactonase YvrE